jgi:hypothetical protein
MRSPSSYKQLQSNPSDTDDLFLTQVSQYLLHSPVAHNLHSVRAAQPTISTISIGRPREHALVLRPCAERVLRAARDAHATKVAQISPNLLALV